MGEMSTFMPGNLVCARGRTYIVQGYDGQWLSLRPFAGAEDQEIELLPSLELTPIKEASFPKPNIELNGRFDTAKLLQDAMRFQLKNGTGPFRSFGSINIEPRPYQLVPLLMAMRQRTTRLLIADDVGIGKTIESGLIVRELLDRGEIKNFAVLCPPNLVEQWQEELDEHFNIKATILSASTAKSLEKKIPNGKKLIDEYPFLVVSLDYIKSSSHRDYFLNNNPNLVLVDEAHTCSKGGNNHQLRFELLSKLSESPTRHMLLLTATPHSGNEDSFFSILSLLDKSFINLKGKTVNANDPLRRKLAQHFIQRKRADLDKEWNQDADSGKTYFPTKEVAEVTYNLNAEWENFFELIKDYCINLISESQNADSKITPIIWYSILALYRCVSSSPFSALSAINNRIAQNEKLDEEDSKSSIEEDDVENESDTESQLQLQNNSELQQILEHLKSLIDSGKDPKYSTLKNTLKSLIQDGFSPIVFCRFIATAKYLEEMINKDFKKSGAEILCITGDMSPEDRRYLIENLPFDKQHILIATDCLSEGINLQEHFDAIVHYDLSWNPTRHEQREGRVDRFGQNSPLVKSVMLYGANNPIDGLILNVILRKSESIKKQLGVTVPVPENDSKINEALVKAALFKKSSSSKIKKKGYMVDLFEGLEIEDDNQQSLDVFNIEWTNASEKIKAFRSIFSQRAIHPDEVYSLYKKQNQSLGGHQDLEFFCRNCSHLLGATLFQSKKSKNVFSLRISDYKDKNLQKSLKDLCSTDLLYLNFDKLNRNDPYISSLSEFFSESAITSESELICRSAACISSDVNKYSVIYLLRIRYLIERRINNRLVNTILTEEILPVGKIGKKNSEYIVGTDVNKLLVAKSSSNIDKQFATTCLLKAQEDYINFESSILNEILAKREQEVKEEFLAVRSFSNNGYVDSVKVCRPIDLIGLYVLLPDED